MTKPLIRMKELIKKINLANVSYYRDNESEITDFEYDKMVEELISLEKETGIVFADSPTHKVGGSNCAFLKKVEHSKPMLSAQKTKSLDELFAFYNFHRCDVSWKLDGLTIVIRYNDGKFVQALTRGENGLIGEDITHTVKHLRGVPKTVAVKECFEVRGEGVISYPEFQLINRFNQYSTPRNAASGLVRAIHIDKNKLMKMDFVAFELMQDSDCLTKEEQFSSLIKLGFNVVDFEVIEENTNKTTFSKIINSYSPNNCVYPVDGLILEFDDISFGKGLGCTEHHENKMMALKWKDEVYESVFRGVELIVGKNGAIVINALFDEVEIDGTKIKKADMHSLSNFEKFCFGVGDKILVHKANMVIPQIVENLTKSNTYKIHMHCPCCGSLLEVKTKSSGVDYLYCPNGNCIGKHSQKIARFCDSDAMNIRGLNATTLEKLMTYGVIKNCADIYKIKYKKDKILDIPGFGIDKYESLCEAIEASREVHLSQFLVALDIPLMTSAAAKEIDEYFYGSFEKFIDAIKNNFQFFHIANVSEGLNRSIYKWSADQEERKFFEPLLKEISFVGYKKKDLTNNSTFDGANVVITGVIKNMNINESGELLSLLGANVSTIINEHTDYLIVGKNPDKVCISKALELNVQIITESVFLKLLK